MDFIFILIAVLIIVSNISKKKQKQAQEEARRRAQQQQPAGQVVQSGQQQSYDMPYTPPPVSMEGRRADPRFPDYTPAPQAAQQRRQAQPRVQQQAQPRVQQQAQPRLQQQAQPRLQQTFQEGEGTEGVGASSIPHASTSVRSHRTTLQEAMGRRHTLEASSITGHAHTETSMSGPSEPCPPAAQIVNAPRLSAVNSGPAALMGDRNALAQAVIFSEILGKPKALRR